MAFRDELQEVETTIERIVDTLSINLSDKGVTPDPSGSLEVFAGQVADIEQGGSSTRWYLDPLWWPIEDIINNDPDADNYPAVRICLVNSFSPTYTVEIGNTGAYPAMVKTSDGGIYTTNTIHTWDIKYDKLSSEGYYTRYIIEYYAVATITKSLQTSCLYFIQSKGYLGMTGTSTLTNLRTFDFINGANMSPTITDLSNFCAGPQLSRLPDNMISNAGLSTFLAGNKLITTIPKGIVGRTGGTYAPGASGFNSGALLSIFFPSPYNVTVSANTYLSREALLNWAAVLIDGTATITLGSTLLGRLSTYDRSRFTSRGRTLIG